MIIVPFKPEHLVMIDMQEKQMAAKGILDTDPGYAVALRDGGEAWTVMVNDAPIICAGLLDMHDGRANAWALFAKQSGRHFIRLVRYIDRYFNTVTYRRIEATVDTRFREAIRLAEILKFEREGLMKSYGRDGSDHYMYARVR